MSSPLLAFLLAASVLALTPGPGMAYVVARTVAGGRAEGLASCFGTAVGGLVHVAAAALGVSALLAQSAWAFGAFKYLGAAYLVYLGLRTLRAPGSPPSSSRPARAAGARPGVVAALRDGAVVEALNVKTAVFFLAFLPQFVEAAEPLAAQLLRLGAVCVGLNTLVDVVAVFGASHFLGSPTARAARERLLRRLSGCTLVGLGVGLAAARRPG